MTTPNRTRRRQDVLDWASIIMLGVTTAVGLVGEFGPARWQPTAGAWMVVLVPVTLAVCAVSSAAYRGWLRKPTWWRRRSRSGDLDGAMFTVYARGEWRYLTSKMIQSEREAAAASVRRYEATLRGDPIADEDLRWWRY